MTRGPLNDLQWVNVMPRFGITSRAEQFHDAFNGDALTAVSWAELWLAPADASAHMHRHGVTPNLNLFNRALTATMTEQIRSGTLPVHADDTHRRRASLYLAHPDHTPADRDAILTSGITFAELDHLLATGTYDRDTLGLLGALT